MILLIGHHGYIGSAFEKELYRRGDDFLQCCHGDAERVLFGCGKIELAINCAAFIPKDSVALCDHFQADTLRGNLLFPARIRSLCERLLVPLAHLSTGYLWNDGVEHSEEDTPQRDFSGYSGFYIGTKVLAEEEVRRYPLHFIWRLSLAFDEFNRDRNYLTKMAKFPEVFDRENSVSHRADFAKSCLDLWKMRAPFGTYNVMNPGSVKASSIVDRLISAGIRNARPVIRNDGNGDSKASVAKLLAAGIKIRTAEEALDDSIRNWKP